MRRVRVQSICNANGCGRARARRGRGAGAAIVPHKNISNVATPGGRFNIPNAFCVSFFFFLPFSGDHGAVDGRSVAKPRADVTEIGQERSDVVTCSRRRDTLMHRAICIKEEIGRSALQMALSLCT
ncbi:hypothetical protein EVAR_92634_1 [Eumeta japonica]|uniref:Uncharacterized protein n=1 Tax=Eumeta variegata TaxID=151549 RepID=A0A4C1SZK0_EUMVA|nr:hypothetical protein EVAR_92634_1 [Eumeta japonica]